MLRRFAYALALAGLGGLAGLALATATPTPLSASSIGPNIGSKIALGGALTDSAGQPTTLGAISHGKPVMIVLFRSAAWCPFCQAQLKGLGPVAAAAQAKGVRFIALSYDKPEVLAAFAQKQNIAFPLYSDTGSKLIDTLRLRDPRYKPDNIAYGVPYPTTLLIDAKGRVKAKTVETDYKIRPSQADLIALLAKA